MDADRRKTKQVLIEELQALRQETARIGGLQEELIEMQRQQRLLRRQLDERCRDIETECTEKDRAAKALQLAELIIDNSPAILFRRLAAEDPDKRKMVYVSPNISRFGYTAEDFLTGRIMFRDIVYPEDLKRIQSDIREFTDQNAEDYTQFYRIVTRGGKVRWVEDRTSVVEDPDTGVRYNQGIVIDIHRRKEAEERLRRSEEKYRRIVETAGEGFLLMNDALEIVDANQACGRIVGFSPEVLIGKNLLEIVTEEYRQILSANREVMSDHTFRQLECDVVARDGRKVPVLIHGSALRDDTGAIIGRMAFVTDMTEHAKALMLAGEVQRSLLPRKGLRVPGLDVAGRNLSCDEIGGDYFDFLHDAQLPESKFSVVVGDLTGHGVDAALLMTTARAFLRMRASQPGTITEIVTEMNRHLAGDIRETGKFMTLFFLAIPAERDRIEWVRAGHEPAWLYDPDSDSFEELMGPGMALGIDDGFVYQSSSKSGLNNGQVIALGTDGIWEGRNTAGEMFGKSRFQEIIRHHADADAEAILDAVFQEHARFTRGTRAEDDITLVIIKLVR